MDRSTQRSLSAAAEISARVSASLAAEREATRHSPPAQPARHIFYNDAAVAPGSDMLPTRQQRSNLLRKLDRLIQRLDPETNASTLHHPSRATAKTYLDPADYRTKLDYTAAARLIRLCEQFADSMKVHCQRNNATHRGLTCLHVRIYKIIVEKIRLTGTAFQSHVTLAKAAKCSKSTVIEGLRRLEAYNFVKIHRRLDTVRLKTRSGKQLCFAAQGTNIYTLVDMPPMTAFVPPANTLRPFIHSFEPRTRIRARHLARDRYNERQLISGTGYSLAEHRMLAFNEQLDQLYSRVDALSTA
jgi:hypothetical protein